MLFSCVVHICAAQDLAPDPKKAAGRAVAAALGPGPGAQGRQYETNMKMI